MDSTVTDTWLTTAEASRLLRISEQSLRKLIHTGELTGYRLGPVKIRLKRSEIDTYLEGRVVTGPVEIRDGRRGGKMPGRRPGQ